MKRNLPTCKGHTVIEAAHLARVGRSRIYKSLAAGELRAKKLGRRTIILEHDLREWLDTLPAYAPA